MSTVTAPSSMSRGILAFNASRVGMLQSCLSNLESSLGVVPDLIRDIKEGQRWREFKFPDSPVIQWNAADFRKFIESPRPHGCETPIHVLEQALRGTDAWEPFQELIRGERGAPEGHPAYPKRDEDTGQFTKPINRNPIPVNGDHPPVDTIPFPRKRDYARESRQGTDPSYILRRLSKARPDLYARVLAGELKPKTAAREAGFIASEFSIPLEPIGAARRILTRFKGEPLAELIRLLTQKDPPHATH